MNIPDKVKICFKDYKVNKIDGTVINDNKVCYGSIEYSEGHINISTLYSDDMQKCTLIHEIIHGIDELFNIDLQESQVEQLAKGLYGVIKDNPEIFKEV